MRQYSYIIVGCCVVCRRVLVEMLTQKVEVFLEEKLNGLVYEEILLLGKRNTPRIRSQGKQISHALFTGSFNCYVTSNENMRE